MSTAAPQENSPELKLSPSSKLNGFEWWRRTLLYQTGLGLNAEEKAQYEFDYNNRNLAEKCQQCNEYRNWMLEYSPSVLFMMDHIKKLTKDKEPILTKENITCDVCDFTKGGGFHPDEGILLCANWIRNKWQLEDILTHELVHVYDYLKFDLDMNNLRHHACTEIRASMLSGECRIWQEIKKTGLGNFGKNSRIVSRDVLFYLFLVIRFVNHLKRQKKWSVQFGIHVLMTQDLSKESIDRVDF